MFEYHTTEKVTHVAFFCGLQNIRILTTMCEKNEKRFENA
jgi:hypothetical protein